MKQAGFAVLAVLAMGAAARADIPLKDQPAIRDGLITAGMAIEIGDKCPSLSVRMIRGYFYLEDLKRQARALGYSDDEINAYVKDKAEKARLEDVGRAQLRDLGTVDGDAESYCAVGRAQMAAGTTLGGLLR
ncbi:DUF5333 domain-containing protein [Limimaricola sp.]|uniref:DUF5333 domain-containing protein n=1 Tax=Limimaricola sp. TaxID=2211665 RepID=UPI0025C3D2C4|nr:DUF5333 domain-containing protein [Limimaricola sp.]